MPQFRLLFADDTLLLASNATDTTTLLQLVIQHSDPLNQAKCQLLVTNDPGGRAVFPDRTELPKKDNIKYLGTDFTNTLNVGMIIRQNITEAAAILRLSTPLWADRQISQSWKLVVFNALIRTKVFYTLETLEVTPSQQKQLDTLFFRGLRKDLKKPATFIDRTWTHERLLGTANAMCRRVAPDQPKHTSFSTYYRTARRKLLGHILRAPHTNLCRQTILTDDNKDLLEQIQQKKLGRPRCTWLMDALQEAWGRIHTRAVCTRT